MEHLLVGCACGLDPATETMAIQIGLAAGLSVPFWFRDRIANVVRRLRGSGGTAETCTDPPEDESPPG